MAKYVLNSPDEPDFALVGIVCQDNQYETLSAINDVLGIHLTLNDYIPFNLKDGKLFKFSLYHFQDEELGIEYYMVPNSSNFEEPGNSGTSDKGLFAGIDVDETVRLIRELPKTDYFLILKGEDIHNFQFRIMDLLKTVPEFIQVQSIEAADLPSRRNLIF